MKSKKSILQDKNEKIDGLISKGKSRGKNNRAMGLTRGIL